MAFKAPEPTPKGLWRRTPPAVFPPVLGLLALGLAWRRGVAQFALPPGFADLVLGAVTALALFALLSYAVKLARRPGVVLEDLRILPGRAGVSAAVLCLYLLAGVFGPIAPEQARPILLLGLVVHAAFTAALIHVFATGPAEQRRVTPVWHLSFTGWIIAAMVALSLGLSDLARVLFWGSLLVALGIWSLSIQQFARESVPAPLRPLLAIHLAPAAILGITAQGFGAVGIAQVFTLITAAGLVTALIRLRWLTAAGFSPLWGAFTFPMAATANLWLMQGGIWRGPGAVLLIAATIAVPVIAAKIFKLWASGQLALKTNAAIA
ncbi:MAG: tellurium resistance protein [Sphingomonadales bacterium]|nr:tellurium resistance protein [Sphingomonadales bacterium]